MENHPHLEHNGQAFVRLEEAWLPHHQLHDLWQFQGILRDIACPEHHYAWRCGLNKYPAGWYSLFVAMFDIGANIYYSQRTVFHAVLAPVKSSVVSIDEESIFIGKQLQLLDSPHALALVMQNDDLHASLCLVKQRSQETYGQNGQIWRKEGGSDQQALTTMAFPQTATSCKLQLSKQQLKLAGRSVVERAFGSYNFRQTDCQWERFYFFFNNGSEAVIWNFPHSHRSQGIFFPLSQNKRSLEGMQMQVMDICSWKDWKFSCKWNVSLPQVLCEDFYLIPLGEPSFAAPCTWLVTGIFSHSGEKLGYCLAELWIGAQSEKERIPWSLFKHS